MSDPTGNAGGNNAAGGGGEPKMYTEQQVAERVLALDGKNRELLGEIRKLKDQFAPFKDVLDKVGDPTKLGEIVTAHSKGEEERQRAAGNFDKMLAERTVGFEKSLGEERSKTQRYANALFNATAKAEAMAAIAKAEGNATLLLPHVIGRLRVVEDGDTFRVQVVGEDGKTPMVADAMLGTPMTVEQFVNTLKANEAFGSAFAAPASSGGGAKGGGTPSGWTGGQAIRLTQAQARDTTTYQRARVEADKRGVDLVILDA